MAALKSAPLVTVQAWCKIKTYTSFWTKSARRPAPTVGDGAAHGTRVRRLAMGGETTLRVVAGVLPKLERLVQTELQTLGVSGRLNVFRGGIEFRAPPSTLWRVAHEARMVEFLRVRVSAPNTVRHWGQLHHRVIAAPWSAFFSRGPAARCPAVSVAADGASQLYHEAAIKQRVTDTIAKRLGINTASSGGARASPSAPPADDGDASPRNRRERRAAARPQGVDITPEEAAQLYRGEYNLDDDSAGQDATPRQDVFVHVHRNRVQLSVNASGELLHKRGYRRVPVGAPIRETLAAACLRMAAAAIRATDAGSRVHCEGDEETEPPAAAFAPPRFFPMWDPFCGSGTYVIEALDWHLGLLGPLKRRFSFEWWPTHDRAG